MVSLLRGNPAGLYVGLYLLVGSRSQSPHCLTRACCDQATRLARNWRYVEKSGMIIRGPTSFHSRKDKFLFE